MSKWCLITRLKAISSELTSCYYCLKVKHRWREWTSTEKRRMTPFVKICVGFCLTLAFQWSYNDILSSATFGVNLTSVIHHHRCRHIIHLSRWVTGTGCQMSEVKDSWGRNTVLFPQIGARKYLPSAEHPRFHMWAPTQTYIYPWKKTSRKEENRRNLGNVG